MSLYSYKSLIEGGADSDIIYYNASVVSNNTKDGAPTSYPPIRFNETRDAPIVRDASQYYFSIIRFAMNGANRNLPLFIPQIQTNGFPYVGQNDPNLTLYYLTLTYQREWYFTDLAGAVQNAVITVVPSSTPIMFRPETQNTTIAPVPVAPPGGFKRQDLSSRYYWVSTYSHMTDLVNETFLRAMFTLWNGFNARWANLPNINVAVSPTPYPTLASFIADHDVPNIQYNETTQLFELYGDTRAFNVSGQFATPSTDALGNIIGTNIRIPEFVPPAPPAPGVAVAKSQPFIRLFFNSALWGLFANFDNTYYGASFGSFLPQPLSAPVQVPTLPAPLLPFVADYTYEILFTNKNYTNIQNNNPSLQGNIAVPPPAYNPLYLIPASKQNLYWKVVQDYDSINSLWSPISAFVFTSTMLPVKKEYTARPNITNDDGNADTTINSASAFEPIIADFVVDQQVEKADGWKDFVLYEPTAEYKMASFTASHEEIRNIDIQVFWKHRITGQLFPIQMYNNSDVSIKVMFRRKDYRD
jgi:hypothetical protein